MNRNRRDNLLRKTLRISIAEGVFTQIYAALTGIGSSFIVKYLLLLQAAPIHFSLVSSIGQISQVFQPLGVALTHSLTHRKKTCVAITAVGRFLTFFLGAALWFAIPHQGIWFVLGLLFVSASLTSIGGNIWIAWICEIVPEYYRGRFFSRRNQVLLVFGLFVGYIASFLTDLFENNQHGVAAFFIRLTHTSHYFIPANLGHFLAWMFVTATALGLIGLAVLYRQPEKAAQPQDNHVLDTFKLPLQDGNFRRLMLFGIWWMLAIGLGSAFWAPFMLKNLQMTLFEVQMYGTISVVCSIFSYRFWGRFIDRLGNKTAMFICIIFGGLNPILWLFMTAAHHNIIWFEALLSGFMWAGAGIVSTNFVLSIAPKGQSQVYSGLYGAFGGISMMLTTMLSGLLYPPAVNLGSLHLAPEQVIFGVGGVARWTAFIPLMFVREAKCVSFRVLSQDLWDYVLSRIRQLWQR